MQLLRLRHQLHQLYQLHLLKSPTRTTETGAEMVMTAIATAIGMGTVMATETAIVMETEMAIAMGTETATGTDETAGNVP
jgi:hypothetical protein